MKKTLWLTDSRDYKHRGFISRNMPRKGRNDFTIKKMKNTTRFKIGQCLSQDMVDNLLTHRTGYSWDIIVEAK